jgi:hypothetical protein
MAAGMRALRGDSPVAVSSVPLRGFRLATGSTAPALRELPLRGGFPSSGLCVAGGSGLEGVRGLRLRGGISANGFAWRRTAWWRELRGLLAVAVTRLPLRGLSPRGGQRGIALRAAFGCGWAIQPAHFGLRLWPLCCACFGLGGGLSAACAAARELQLR